MLNSRTSTPKYLSFSRKSSSPHVRFGGIPLETEELQNLQQMGFDRFEPIKVIDKEQTFSYWIGNVLPDRLEAGLLVARILAGQKAGRESDWFFSSLPASDLAPPPASVELVERAEYSALTHVHYAGDKFGLTVRALMDWLGFDAPPQEEPITPQPVVSVDFTGQAAIEFGITH